jgi:heat shock protein HslJ
MRWLPIFPVLLLLLLAACDAFAGPSLDGTEWLSIRVTDGGGEDRPLVAGTRIRLSFADGQVGASAGCNTIGGTYRIEGGRLVFEGGGMTEMGCDDERHAQDDWLGALLGSRPTVTVAGDELTLAAGDDVVVLQDRETADPDLPLIGTTWTVESLISGDAVSSVPGGGTATLVFTEGGQVQIDTGCNSGSGTYEVDGDTLRVTDIQTTLVGCEGPSAQLENAVGAVLNAHEIQFAIEAGSLTLMAGDQGLGLRGD